MEGGVEIRSAELAARKRAAPAVTDFAKSVKRAAASSRGGPIAHEEQTVFLCWPTKTARTKPSDGVGASPLRSKGRSWRYTMRRRDILHSRDDQGVAALKEDLSASSQTIFE
eukprot:7199037-Pyramimonas_sp.AAC.1